MTTQILIFKEKHGKRYFDASTEELKLKAFHKIIKERFNDGYWYHKPESLEKYISSHLSKEKRELLEITDEALSALPQSIQDKVVEVRTLKARLEKRHALEVAEYEEIEKVATATFEEAKEMVNRRPSRLKPGTTIVTPILSLIMQSRGDYEYEGFDIETLEKVEED